jgi:hypothetical protein
MADMSKMEGVQKLIKLLQDRAKRLTIAGNKPKHSVIVGYTADYAIYVHENKKAYHKPPTSAKFLEIPFREMQPKVSILVKEGLKHGMDIPTILLTLGNQLLRASLILCPIETGALRGSGFCKAEE